jgi:ribose/xylose/arabinose/galactoside ABC-type transport system permease subunit
MLYEAQLGTATNTLGFGLEFQVHAALRTGGYSIFRGGVGNPAGGAMGLLVVAGVTDIIDIKGVNTYYTDVILGALTVLAVLLDRARGGDAFC